MKAIILIAMLVFITQHISAEETKADPDKLTFTKEEFRKAVYEELDKKMKKIGRSRLLEFAKELLEKEEKLAQREKEIIKREEQIKVNEGTLKLKFTEFKMEQEKFLSCLDKADQEVANRMRHMVDVVAGMKPQTAANLLSQQDPSLSVKIISKLEPIKIAKIFNLMEKEVSAKLQKQFMTNKR